MANRLLDVVGLPGTGRLNNNGCVTTCAGVAFGACSTSRSTGPGRSGIASRSGIACIAGIPGISCLAFRSSWASSSTQPEQHNQQRGRY